MKDEFCSECGHVLSKNRNHCSFCGWRQEADPINDLTLNFGKEKDFIYDYIPVTLPPDVLDAGTTLERQLNF